MSARATAIGLLARRDYSTHELRRKLLDRGHTPEAIEAAVDDLRAQGGVDDQRVAAAHVRTASRVKSRGRIRVRRELEARGIPRSIVEEALAGLAAVDEAAAIRRILARRRWSATPTLAERRRMYQHLLRRGFPSASIRRALGGSPGELNDPEDE